jgi:hypothetical protein
MFIRSISILILAVVAGAGCSKEDAAKPQPAPAAKADKAEKGHAPAGVTPGSYEDWCEEHQVPESQCTRCNPELIPAFKATNDWCPEHGLPESQCTICNPEIVIKRPPKGP